MYIPNIPICSYGALVASIFPFIHSVKGGLSGVGGEGAYGSETCPKLLSPPGEGDQGVWFLVCAY